MLGMPTLIELNNFEDNAKLAHKLSLDFIELNMNMPAYFEMNCDEINLIKEKYNLKLSMHLSEDFDPFDFDPIIRKARLKTFEKAILIGKCLDVFKYTMHLSTGIHFSMPNGKVYLYDQYKDQYMTYVHEFIQLVEASGITVNIENTGIHHHGFIKEATSCLLKSPCFQLTYDIGHDLTSGGLDKFYREHHSHVNHYHIHDGNHLSNHMPLFEGDFNFSNVFKEIKEKNASMVIEVKTVEGLKKSIKELRNNYENICNETWTNRMES